MLFIGIAVFFSYVFYLQNSSLISVFKAISISLVVVYLLPFVLDKIIKV